MKTFKPIVVIILITLLSLLYVHTEIEIIKIGYKVKHSETKISKLLDRNRILMYNVATLRTPASLEKSLFAKKADYYMPKEVIVVKEIDTNNRTLLVKSSEPKKSIFSFLEPKKTAEAQE